MNLINKTTIRQLPTNKQVYFWNICGSFVNALNSIILLLLVTRILGDSQGDVFSIAWAIGQLALTIGTFQVRLYQATDVEEVYQAKQYLTFRYYTIGAMLLYSIFHIIYTGYPTYDTIIILLICGTKGIDALSDVFGAWFQQKERLDLAGKGLTTRVVFGMLFFALAIIITKSLLIGCVAMLLANACFMLLFNVRYFILLKGIYPIKKQAENKAWAIKLFLTCTPLFINAFLIMTIFNEPKMAIDQAIRMGTLKTGSQAYFSILFMPASVMNLVFIVFRPLITKMAIEWNKKNTKGFFKIVFGIVFCLLVIAVLVLGGGWLLGIPVLSLLYGVDLGPFKISLMLLLLGGVLNTLVNVLDNGLTVIRKHMILTVAYIVTWVYSKSVTGLLVSKYGLMGASVSFLTSMFVLLVCTIIIFTICIRYCTKKEKRHG